MFKWMATPFSKDRTLWWDENSDMHWPFLKSSSSFWRRSLISLILPKIYRKHLWINEIKIYIIYMEIWSAMPFYNIANKTWLVAKFYGHGEKMDLTRICIQMIMTSTLVWFCNHRNVRNTKPKIMSAVNRKYPRLCFAVSDYKQL